MNNAALRIFAGSAAMLAAFAPVAAQAHLVVSGMGPVYDGVSHFALSPEDFLPVIALAFFAGLRGSRHARFALAALVLAWIAGGLAAMLGPVLPGMVLEAGTALLFLVIGGLLAANVNAAPVACALAAAALGAARGAADLAGVDMSLPHLLMLLGMSASVFMLFAVAVSVTLPLKRMWMIVAARVSGSWLAATGLLLAGWLLRYGDLVRT